MPTARSPWTIAAQIPLLTQRGHGASLNGPHLNRYDAHVLSLGGGNETARVHHTAKCRGNVAAHSARAATGAAGGRVCPRRVARSQRALCGGVPQRPQRIRL